MLFEPTQVFGAQVLPGETPDDSLFNEITAEFRKFITEFRIANSFIYREQLRENLRIKSYYLRVNTEHLILYNEELNKKLSDDPGDIIPLFEAAITTVAKTLTMIDNDTPVNEREFPTCQLLLDLRANHTPVRDLDLEHILKIVRVPGIIISALVLSLRATVVQLVCRNCKHLYRMRVPPGFGPIQLPTKCQGNHIDDAREKCPPDPYVIVHDKLTFVDQQSLKLQEAPDMVPVGEMPRHIMLQADRYMTNQVVPGTRVTIVGVYSIYQLRQKGREGSGAVAIRNPYLRILGIQTDVDSTLGGGVVFSEEEEERFIQLLRHPNLYQEFTNSIAPSIYGNEDIKRAIACLLLGGLKKILPDGMRLRGDINVLLLGDPGTAKSQLLKFVEKIAPISVYTSGKGSSAAGLTASVQRDPTTRDFYLEGGAMVLADGGVVCIDEFDKMRDEDRVAIHEAMEQQTISIAKAGITTVLNLRTLVLAAANPIFGRYDDMKLPGENIDFQTTILSRFDMIFIVKDVHNELRDILIAEHVMNVHTGNQRQNQESEGEIPGDLMKRYIQYCKLKCAPRLSAEALERLSSHFVQIRHQLQVSELEQNERLLIPITVRQLEAIIRITELLAKLTLSPVATEEHVEEAIRLFTASTMNAVEQGVGLGTSGKDNAEIRRAQDEICKRLPMGWSTNIATLRRDLVDRGLISNEALNRALYVMERYEQIKFRHQGQNVLRVGI